MQLILAAYTGSQVNSSLGSIFTVSLVIFARVAACFKRDRLRRIGKGSYATVWKGRDDRRLAARTWHRMTTPPKKTRIMHGTRKWWMFKKEIPCLVQGRFETSLESEKPEWWSHGINRANLAPLKDGISRNHFGWIPGPTICWCSYQFWSNVCM